MTATDEQNDPWWLYDIEPDGLGPARGVMFGAGLGLIFFAFVIVLCLAAR